MLLTLMTATSPVTFLASAIFAARHEHASLEGYVTAILIGLLLAVCNAWAIYGVCGKFANLTSPHSISRKEWYGRAFVLIMVLWLPVAAFFGDWVTSAVVRR